MRGKLTIRNVKVMDKVKIGIVEDDEIISRNIQIVLKELGYETTLPANNYETALSMIANEKPDLVMLDIQLDGEKDGINLAQTINELFKIPFIFLTSSADKNTIERAKKVFPPAYLIKPFNKEDLYSAIEICLYNFSKETNPMELTDSYSNKDSIFIKDGYYFHKIKTQDIYYLESDHVYTALKKICVRASLNDYIENFSKNIFFRPHRSYAVNLDHIETINSEFIIIKGDKIPITKIKRDELLGILNIN